jgi:tetratricopeptide (TPR) repeat protein
MSDTAAADIARAERLVAQALMAAPRSPLAHFARGHILRAQNRLAEAITEYDTVIAFDRNRVGAYANIGQCKFYRGSIEEYLPLVERAIHLSPRDPQIGVWYGRIGLVHLLQSRTGEAILWLEKARNADPALPYVRSRLASAYALAGETERAAVELAEAGKLSGDDRHASIAKLLKAGETGSPLLFHLLRFPCPFQRRTAERYKGAAIPVLTLPCQDGTDSSNPLSSSGESSTNRTRSRGGEAERVDTRRLDQYRIS